MNIFVDTFSVISKVSSRRVKKNNNKNF